MEFSTEKHCYHQYGLIDIIVEISRPTELDCFQLTGQVDPSRPKP